MRFLFALAAVGAGVAATLQGAANAGLAAQTGLGAALVLNTTVVLFSSLTFFFASGSPAVFFPATAPWLFYIGGLCGFAVILAIAFVFPRIGAGPSIALMVFGQGAAALAIDHFGLMGLARQPISPSRIFGFALIIAGIALLRR
jgi:transporter family-2 protein